MYERILIPTDGSETAQRATRHAIELAERFDAEVHVLVVIEQHHLYAGTDITSEHLWDEIAGKARDAAGKRMAPILKAARSRGLEAVDAIREHPDVAQAIVAYAKEAGIDAIVMGTHGRSGIRRLLVGSVAERVVRSSPVPVLLVPPEDDDG